MSYTVKTELFEGPFELLLYLVTRKRVDIGAISINEITDQYLAEVSKMKRLDLDIASDFLVVASTLLEMKAHALVPREKSDLEIEVEELGPTDAQRILIERLEEYKKFKNAASAFEEMMVDEASFHSRPFGPDRCFLGLMPDFLDGIALDRLGILAAAAIARRERMILDSEHIASRVLPVDLYMGRIKELVSAEGNISFGSIIREDPRPEVIVVSFLAILELYKRGIVNLSQVELFGEIEIGYIGQSDRTEDIPLQTIERTEIVEDASVLFDEEMAND